MGLLLVMQYFTNKPISRLQYQTLKRADIRIQFLHQILKGIRQIKCALLEKHYAERVHASRAFELKSFTSFCNLKNIFGAIYFNAGVIISALLFILVDKDRLELGKVFSTLALLGYIFNFSILYSNYAIESLMALNVFIKRIENVITKPLSERSLETRVDDTDTTQTKEEHIIIINQQ